MLLRRTTNVFICFLMISLIMNVANYSESRDTITEQQKSQQAEPVSKAKLMGLSAISSLSPGVALLSIVYNVKKERNADGQNGWLVNWLWLYWIIAFIDVTLDKFPIAAQANQFVEHVLIWYTAYVSATALGTDTTMLLGALTGSGVQGVRQAYSVAIDGATVGIGAPARSTIEDVIAGVSTYLMLQT